MTGGWHNKVNLNVELIIKFQSIYAGNDKCKPILTLSKRSDCLYDLRGL